ncbi:hypothetical protein GcC1_084032 [Golovinomyces cichoracearum]|uniref:Uncharacterized protein n=1 Tax=Golovinomyces cichoracearum TaxID=62708 RepID=A0A420IIX3_9PEZI|nr:hypothetical protein GcC1_084032 [Golovinomyces cichoracearum]
MWHFLAVFLTSEPNHIQECSHFSHRSPFSSDVPRGSLAFIFFLFSIVRKIR